MKNPFIKEDDESTVLIIGVAIGAIAVGALTFIYLSRKAQLKAAAEELKAHAKDYLEKKAPKKHKLKTDIHELQNIAEHQHGG